MRNILVTGTGATGTGASIVHALRQAKPQGYWGIIAADANPFSWGLYAADHGVLIPYPGDPEYLDQILGVIEKYKIEAVIPGTEPDLVFLSEHRDKLPLIANKAELLPLMQDKRLAAEKLKELRLPFIPGYPWSERRDAVREWGFPLIVKPMKNTSGSRGLFLIMNDEDLAALRNIAPDSEVQPYIGDDLSEYTVGVMSRSNGTVIDSIAIRRELTGLSLKERRSSRHAISSGFTQGYIVRHGPIQDFCEDLARKLGSTGPLNIQLRLGGGLGLPYVFEIHPRFSGSTGIRASAGFNEPDTMLRHMLDKEEFVRFDYKANVTAIRYLDHILVPSGELK